MNILSLAMAKRKHLLTTVLCFCLLSLQVLPGYASYLSNQDAVRVAYLGLGFTGVDEEQQSNIDTRISVLLETEPLLYSIPQQQIQSRLDVTLLNRIRQQLRKEDLQEVGRQLDVDHIFVGNIENQSRNQDVAALTGQIVRYDVATDNLYTLRIQTFFDDFNSELVRINNQLVRTIVPEKKKSFFKRYLPGVLIVAATALAVGLLLGKTDGQSSGTDGGPTPPFTGN